MKFTAPFKSELSEVVGKDDVKSNQRKITLKYEKALKLDLKAHAPRTR